VSGEVGPIMPPFPVDAMTLEILWQTLHPDPALTDRTHVSEYLDMMAQMAGSDLSATEAVTVEMVVMKRDPSYSLRDVVASLIREVRRLRDGFAAVRDLAWDLHRPDRQLSSLDVAVALHRTLPPAEPPRPDGPRPVNT
jgi:hypothetical protein